MRGDFSFFPISAQFLFRYVSIQCTFHTGVWMFLFFLSTFFIAYVLLISFFYERWWREKCSFFYGNFFSVSKDKKKWGLQSLRCGALIFKFPVFFFSKLYLPNYTRISILIYQNKSKNLVVVVELKAKHVLPFSLLKLEKWMGSYIQVKAKLIQNFLFNWNKNVKAFFFLSQNHILWFFFLPSSLSFSSRPLIRN